MHRGHHKNTIVAGGLALALSATAAFPGSLYDVKIERAAMDLIARRIGDIRPGLAFDAKIPASIPSGQRAEIEKPRAAAGTSVVEAPGAPQVGTAAPQKDAGSFVVLGAPASEPATEARPPRKGAVPKLLKF